MKTLFLLVVNLLFTTVAVLQAQDKMPQAVSYQAVVRDAQGKVVAGKPVGIQVEILKGSPSGTVVFSEIHKPTSSQTGTVNLLIGQGTSKTGTFSSIDWGTGTYYLQLSMDLNGGSNYEKVSTTQMLPVPYALYARYAEKAGVTENGGSGNIGSTNTIKFTFVVNDDDVEEDLYPLFSGELIKSSNDILLRFTLLYLDGVDQELTVSIDGLTPEKNEVGKSSCVGRMFYLTYNNVSDGNYILVVRDKNNNMVKEYPFTFKMLNK
ncbi:hypothetical protein M1P97_03360 [Parabacteroides sp. GYB001]|uniref:hypothetical protein n=1 Tax=Parabacteroides leei TaxID=2939491 RepID=UPI002017AE27|nr:hypothetical protein [Parabacteroides leei]MCL3850328.1 hypothetical protein [Parabacteroides leei]